MLFIIIHRHLHLTGLAIQTTLPPESPGFVVVFSLVPSESEDSVRSKVYMIHDERRSVDISLNETFQLNCSDRDVESCAASDHPNHECEASLAGA